MWAKFHEEAWKKTAIRILAKRLPLTNPGMEALAEVIERDARTEMEMEPAGRLELEPDSPISQPCSLQPTEKVHEISSAPEVEGNAVVFFQVGRQTTIVSGQTILLKNDLPKVGGKWDKQARVWNMPAARTHELLAVCDEKGIRTAEVSSDKPGELF
jgi:hypothetical protein